MAIEWSIIDEIRLFRWVAEFKPAGIHKHFHMMCIVDRMNHPEVYPVTLLQKDSLKIRKVFTTTDIWEKLKLYYDLEAMDRLEYQELKLPTPTGDKNEIMLVRRYSMTHQRDFELTWDEYGELILDNAKDGVAEETNEDRKSKNQTYQEEQGGFSEINTGEAAALNSARTRRSTRLRRSSRVGADRDKSDQSSDTGPSDEYSNDDNDDNENNEQKTKDIEGGAVVVGQEKENQDENLKVEEDQLEDQHLQQKQKQEPEQKENHLKSSDDENDSVPKNESEDKKQNAASANQEENNAVLKTKTVSEDHSLSERQDEADRSTRDNTNTEQKSEETDAKVHSNPTQPASNDQPLAKRTRHSSTVTPASAEISPKRKKRAIEQSRPSVHENNEQQVENNSEPRGEVEIEANLEDNQEENTETNTEANAEANTEANSSVGTGTKRTSRRVSSRLRNRK